MQYICVCPPGLIIVIEIFWETTHIHDPEMRADIRPFKWRGFTTVVKTGPYKSSTPIIIFCCQFPPVFGAACPPWGGDILVGQIAADRIFFIDAARGYGGAHLRF